MWEPQSLVFWHAKCSLRPPSIVQILSCDSVWLQAMQRQPGRQERGARPLVVKGRGQPRWVQTHSNPCFCNAILLCLPCTKVQDRHTTTDRKTRTFTPGRVGPLQLYHVFKVLLALELPWVAALIVLQVFLADRAGATLSCRLGWFSNLAPEGAGQPQVFLSADVVKTKIPLVHNLDLQTTLRATLRLLFDVGFEDKSAIWKTPLPKTPHSIFPSKIKRSPWEWPIFPCETIYLYLGESPASKHWQPGATDASTTSGLAPVQRIYHKDSRTGPLLK